jgi:chromosome segregation ATPase
VANKADELTKIDRNIKDCENRLKTFSSNIETIQKEIDFLQKMENQLQENISYLKRNKVVTLAEEYAKSKADLKKTKIRLTQLKSDKTINEKAHKELCVILEKNKEAYDKLVKQSTENNVLQGRFGGGRKRG